MYILRQININFRLFVLTIIMFVCSSIYSEQVTDNHIKTGFISNFLKYVSWENENSIDTFKIGIYGDDDTFIGIIKSLEKIKAKNKPIQITSLKSINEFEFVHLLIVTNDKNYQIKDIYEIIKDHNTLLITDRCDFQRYVMINFIYNENSKIQFEINTRNLEEAKTNKL